jgi:hypothetical protein
MIDKSFSSLPPIGGGINGAIPKGVIAPPLSGAPAFSPYTGAPFYSCSLDPLEVHDCWFWSTKLEDWVCSGWVSVDSWHKLKAIYDSDRVLCPDDFDPRILLGRKS